MTKKKKKVEHQATTEHKPKNPSALTDEASGRIVSSDNLDNDSMTRQATKRAASKIETTDSQHQTVSLLDLPLEILYMVFDYVACRNHLEDHEGHHYRIQVVPEGELRNNLVIHRPTLLMVCSTLRTGLSPYFYSTCSFHVKIQMRSMMSSTGDALTLRQLEDRLPLPYQLSSVKFTIDIHDLSTEGFDFSVFVQIAKLIFEEHRTKKNQPELFQLDWWLESSDPVLQCNCVRTLFNDWLVRLLDEVLDKTISTAVQTSENFQTFSDPDNRAYIIIETLRDLMRCPGDSDEDEDEY
ncbi:hypothetical protein KCU61_g5589, partial [Aureobasidium melanogenum]